MAVRAHSFFLRLHLSGSAKAFSFVRDNAVMFWLLVVASVGDCVDNDGYVSLELNTGSPSAASHSLSVTLTIGRPERRYSMLVDFARDEIEMRSCLRSRSFSFDIARGANFTNDIVMFSDDTLLDPVKRGIYRMPIREHCAGDDAPPFVSPECEALEGCEGVLGLGPHSPVWAKWSLITATRNALHLGSSNPHRIKRKAEKIQCLADSASLCEFSALFAGRQVTVDFSSLDSYIYVPADIYKLYVEGRNLYGFTNAQRRSALRLQTARQRVLTMAETDDETNGTLSRALFAERLETERQLAAQYSVYYRNTRELTDRGDWPPLVVLSLEDTSMSNVVVFDHDLLVFSPLSSGSYGKRARLSAAMPFADRSDALMTLMLRPQKNESVRDRVTLGNMFFRRYNVQKNVATNEIEIVERFSSDNLADVEVLSGLYLYGYFIYSLCRMAAYSVALTLGLNRRCPVCFEATSPYTRHNIPPTALVIFGVIGDTALLVVSLWLLMHIETFLAEVVVQSDAAVFATWSWLLALPNIVVVALIRFAAVGHRAPCDGTFCWRTFRWTVAYAACSEQAALLGLLWISLILQTDTLGTTLSVLVAGAMFFSAAHHFLHVFLYEYSFATNLRRFAIRSIYTTPNSPSTTTPASVTEKTKKGNFPDNNSNTVWFGFVLVILLLLNLVFASFVMLRYVVVPTLNSLPFAVLVYGVALLLALMLLDVYEKIIIGRSKFSLTLY